MLVFRPWRGSPAKLIAEKSQIILVQFGHNIPGGVVIVLSKMPRLLPDSGLEVRQAGGGNAHSLADLIEVLFEVLVADDKICAELVVDDIKAIVVLQSATLDELGKLALDDLEFIEGDAQIMIKALAGFY